MTDEQVPPIINQLSAIHEQVRTLVEAYLGSYRVTKIEGCTESHYMLPYASEGEIDPSRIVYILGFLDVSFDVEAVQVPATRFSNRASVQVRLLSDGTLRIGHSTITEQVPRGWIAREEQL